MNRSDYIFTRTITDDEVFLEKCIDLEQELKDALFDGGSMNEGMNFINFLQIHYTNDEIIKIWWSIEMLGPGITQDGMKFFRAIDERLLFHNFKKVDNSFIDLYTEFVKLKTFEKEWLKTHPIDFSYYAINNTDYISV